MGGANDAPVERAVLEWPARWSKESFNREVKEILFYAGVPERSNGLGLGPSGLVPTQVQILSPA